jgi:uncharacterized alpha/beta hydrolase family protein
MKSEDQTDLLVSYPKESSIKNLLRQNEQATNHTTIKFSNVRGSKLTERNKMTGYTNRFCTT